MLYLNIRSLRSKINDVELILINQNADILCLTETWLYNNEVQNFYIKGYNMAHSCRDSRGGGLLIYLKKNIEFNIKTIKNKENNEILIVNITKKNINIGVAYRQPSSNVKKFIEFFDTILHSYKNLLLIGDININLLDNNNITKEYTNMLKSNGFKILNKMNSPTRIDLYKNTNSLIDHIISDYYKNLNIILEDCFLSDHKSIFFEIPNFFTKKKINKQKYNITNINFDNVIKNLQNRLNSNDSSNLTFEDLGNVISDEISKNTTILNLNYCFNIKEGWFTKELLDLISERNKLYKYFKKFPNNEYLKKLFFDLKKKIKHLIHFNKKKFYEEKFKQTEGNPKKIWNILKELCNSKNINNNYSLLNDSGKLVTDNYQIANIFNNHFTNVANKIITKYSKKNNTNNEDNILKNNKFNMYIKKTNESEILEIITDLKSNSAPGWDGIRTNHIKKIKNVIAYHISKIINKNIDNSEFPSSLKKAKITPIYKDNDKNDVNNYRPISVLPVLSKIYEKILYKRLMSFLNEINFISPFQNGFLKGKNTEIAITELFDYLYNEFDKKKSIRGIFLDFRKAFDIVSHDILLKKMYNIGIRNKSWQIFKNYLTERYQITVINNISSESKLIEYGVPQGSVLGPLLFLLYINDISEINLKGNLMLYADDIALFYSGNTNNINNDINYDIQKIEKWCNKNSFFLNENKCFYLDIGNYMLNSCNLKINNYQIKKVNNYKYLGLIIDSQLNFKDHINKIISKLSKWTGLFRRFSFYLNSNTRKLLYFSYVQSNLIYLSSIWGQGNKTDLERLQRCQNKTIKILYNFPYEISTDLIYKNTNFFKVSEIITQQNIKLIHKIKTNQIKTNINICNSKEIHHYNTRNCLDFYFNTTNTIKAKNAITHNGLILYNTIPKSLKSINKIEIFNAYLKKYFLNKRKNSTTFSH